MGLAKGGVAIAGLMIAMTATPARAEDSAQDFLRRIDAGDRQTLLALHSMATGLQWSNAFLITDGKPPIYCSPRQLAITPEQNVEILRRHVAANRRASAAPAGLALLMGYRDAFPCQ